MKTKTATDLAPNDIKWHWPLPVTLLRHSVLSCLVNSQTNNILNITQQVFLSLKLYKRSIFTENKSFKP